MKNAIGTRTGSIRQSAVRRDRALGSETGPRTGCAPQNSEPGEPIPAKCLFRPSSRPFSSSVFECSPSPPAFPLVPPPPSRPRPPLPLHPVSTPSTRPVCCRRRHRESLTMRFHNHVAPSFSPSPSSRRAAPSCAVMATSTHLAVDSFLLCTKTTLEALGKYQSKSVS
jgi:hypothetical protein